uniref:Uncharacterized protein n=1 Tax=Panagrolaimus superbus TaxID=310955 RepID=A0A914Z1U7_9BILA
MSFIGQLPDGLYDKTVIFSTTQSVHEDVPNSVAIAARHPLESHALYSRKVVEMVAAALPSKYAKRECMRCHQMSFYKFADLDNIFCYGCLKIPNSTITPFSLPHRLDPSNLFLRLQTEAQQAGAAVLQMLKDGDNTIQLDGQPVKILPADWHDMMIAKNP